MTFFPLACNLLLVSVKLTGK